MIPIRDINPTSRFAVVTLAIVVLNIVVFLYEGALDGESGDRFLAAFALIPRRLFFPETISAAVVPAAATLVTSMFMHGGFLHIAGNMLYLWIFGNNVEDASGRFRFAVFYLLCGIAAAYAHAVIHRTSLTPMIGASGAVSGVLGAYLLLFPRARVVTLVWFGLYVRTVEIPAILVLGMWFVIQVLNTLLSGGSAAGVAWHAHLAGFIAGVLLIGMFKRTDVEFGGGRRSREL